MAAVAQQQLPMAMPMGPSDDDAVRPCWASVPGHLGLEASDGGDIRLNGSPMHQGKPEPYVRVTVAPGRRARVHHLVALAFLGSPPRGMVCDHINENKLDNRLTNLRWLPLADNSRRSLAGRARDVGRKLSDEDVEAIRCAPGSQRELAKAYGVNQSTVSRILSEQRRTARL